MNPDTLRPVENPESALSKQLTEPLERLRSLNETADFSTLHLQPAETVSTLAQIRELSRGLREKIFETILQEIRNILTADNELVISQATERTPMSLAHDLDFQINLVSYKGGRVDRGNEKFLHNKAATLSKQIKITYPNIDIFFEYSPVTTFKIHYKG